MYFIYTSYNKTKHIPKMIHPLDIPSKLKTQSDRYIYISVIGFASWPMWLQYPLYIQVRMCKVRVHLFGFIVIIGVRTSVVHRGEAPKKWGFEGGNAPFWGGTYGDNILRSMVQRIDSLAKCETNYIVIIALLKMHYNFLCFHMWN